MYTKEKTCWKQKPVENYIDKFANAIVPTSTLYFDYFNYFNLKNPAWLWSTQCQFIKLKKIIQKFIEFIKKLQRRKFGQYVNWNFLFLKRKENHLNLVRGVVRREYCTDVELFYFFHFKALRSVIWAVFKQVWRIKFLVYAVSTGLQICCQTMNIKIV